MAHEIEDTATEDRLRDFAESEYQPRFFGDGNDRFAFWFGYDSTWPRGQLNATLMVAESGSAGAWWQVFNEPRLALAQEPELRGVDCPSIGPRRLPGRPLPGMHSPADERIPTMTPESALAARNRRPGSHQLREHRPPAL
jgi:hypothetical protein